MSTKTAVFHFQQPFTVSHCHITICCTGKPSKSISRQMLPTKSVNLGIFVNKIDCNFISDGYISQKSQSRNNLTGFMLKISKVLTMLRNIFDKCCFVLNFTVQSKYPEFSVLYPPNRLNHENRFIYFNYKFKI